MFRIVICSALALLLAAPAFAQPKSIRLPSVSIKERILWGSTLEEPEGVGLSFGGQDQQADDGNPHTRIKVDGQWKAIHEDLWQNHKLTPFHRIIADTALDVRSDMVLLRAAYLEGKLTDEATAPPAKERWTRTLAGLAAAIETQHTKRAGEFSEYETARLKDAIARLKELGEDKLPPHHPAMPANALLTLRTFDGKHGDLQTRARQEAWPAVIMYLHRLQTALEQAAEWLAAEPPARALSPLAYDAKTKRYILFAGDHLDYLTNDTWLFDPATKRWELRRPKTAPPARANHTLKITDGKVTLTGGYTYTNSTGYTSHQYREHADGDWTYDIAANTWTSAKETEGVSPDSRVYRTGPFHPDFFLDAPSPDPKANEDKLKNLPENTWVSMKPPKLPELNRDWGTAVIDTDRDLMLRFSGGHSAHGGSDVLHYHFATNRWELPFPVEFPLGQLYDNTEYPRGFNFNRRPWVTGHTYQSYGYDPRSKTMLFTGEDKHTYIYDPDAADWTGRFVKPKEMAYGSCFYTLTLVTTKHGLVTWTQGGKLLRFDDDHREWMPIETTGEKLPGSVVDNSTVTYDSKRDRLLFFSKSYGDKTRYDGKIPTFDFATGKVTTLTPKGFEAAVAVPYLCQIRYDPTNDVLLVGGTMDAPEGQLRRTPIYDCAADQWKSLKITGDDPSGKKGRNVSLGMMYDAKRKLFWAVDTKSNVFVLRLNPATAEAKGME